jgi:predicted transcriptional regulator
MVEPIQDKHHLDEQSLKIVTTALNQLGDIGDLVMRRKSDIFPALMQSACVLVLSEEEHRTVEDIAQLLELPVGTVRSILEAPMQGYEERLRYKLDDSHEFERHTDPQWSDMPSTGHLEDEYLAGALAKSAYTIVRRSEGKIKTYP